MFGTRISSHLLAVAVILCVGTAASLLAHNAEFSENGSDAVIPAAPAPIAAAQAPRLSDVTWRNDLYDADLVRASWHTSAPEYPSPPVIDVGTIRELAAAWLGTGIAPAPTATISAGPPRVEADVLDHFGATEASTIEWPVIERPALPEPPAIR